MSDGRIELGIDGRLSPKGMPPRRRLFEGGSGVISSSFSHKSPLNLRTDAWSVREQAANLSSRAVQEHSQDRQSSFLEDEETLEGIAEEMGHARHQEEDGEFHFRFGSRLGSTADSRLDLTPTVSKSSHGEDFGESTHTASPRDGSPFFSAIYPFGSSHSESAGYSGQAADEPTSKSSSTLIRAVYYIPAVLVGSLLNILDGLSYGMILFPLGLSVFSGLESAGLSLFYTSTIIAQLVFSLGGSGFNSCIGSEMIEIVPFFHALAISISRKLADRPSEEIIATTLVSFAVSSIITGLTFFLLGWLKLGALVGFFPLHILLGCIGGVGWFLIATGVEVSARLQGGVEYNLTTLSYLFGSFEVISQWGSCLALAALLMYSERRLRHPLVVPTILVSSFLLFHAVVAILPNVTLTTARDHGWVFPAQQAGESWYWIYTFYQPSLIHVGPIVECIPVMLALNFFGIIHVPINIPALAAAIKEDSFNVNRELVAHGISNTLSGLCGSIQNYLVYTNSVMFIKSGADSPLAGIMLAIATAGIMLAGPGIIGYIPVLVVGSLIFMMGFDLIAEALVDTYGSVRKQDYATMVTITLIMGCYDFVVGIFAGIVLACLFFVIINARRSPIVSEMSGSHAHSTVICHPVLQQYLRKVGQQVYIMRLSGSLFFGTNGTLEREVRKMCDCHANGGVATIKYLVVDLENVSDIDYCTVDTFLRLKRLLDSCRIRLVLSGAETAGHKIRGLKAVDLVPEEVDHNDPLSVRVFNTLNIALSWCENQFIKEYYAHSASLAHHHELNQRIDKSKSRNPVSTPSVPTSIPVVSKWGMTEFGMENSPNVHDSNTSLLGTTPRSSYIKNVARMTVNEDMGMLHKWRQYQQPVALLMQIVEPFTSKDVHFWAKLAPFFESKTLGPSQSIPAGFHLIESGILHIQYPSGYYETALAGTTVGELNTKVKRETEIRTEGETKLWTLSSSGIQKLLSSKNGFELHAELLSTYLGLVMQRYTRMTDYYRIASNC
nr:ST.5 [Starmerella bombicola]